MGGINKAYGGPGGSYYNTGEMVGALGAGVANVRKDRARRGAWEITAEQFAGLGPDGQKIAAMIRDNPQAAHLHAERMGGWSNLYGTTKSGYHRGQVADQIVKAGADNRYTGEEKRGIALEGFRSGVPPAATNAVIGQMEGNYDAIFRQMSPYNWKPDSLVRMNMTMEETGDPLMALAEAEPYEEEGLSFPKNANNLIKAQIYRSHMKKNGQEESEEYKENQKYIKKLIKETQSGGPTAAQADRGVKIRDARSRIRQMRRDRPDMTRGELFGKETGWVSPFNPEDPMLADLIRKAMDKDPFESAQSYAEWMDWIVEAFPMSGGGPQPDFTGRTGKGDTPVGPTAKDLALMKGLDKELGVNP